MLDTVRYSGGFGDAAGKPARPAPVKPRGGETPGDVPGATLFNAGTGGWTPILQFEAGSMGPTDQKNVSPELSATPSLSVTTQPLPAASTAKPSTFSAV